MMGSVQKAPLALSELLVGRLQISHKASNKINVETPPAGVKVLWFHVADIDNNRVSTALGRNLIFIAGMGGGSWAEGSGECTLEKGARQRAAGGGRPWAPAWAHWLG